MRVSIVVCVLAACGVGPGLVALWGVLLRCSLAFVGFLG